MEKQSVRASGKRVTQRQIASAVHHIVEKFDPEKIILFGSYAYGKPTAQSDVDLLIIMRETMPRWKQVGAIYSSFDPYPFSMDIQVLTPEHLRERTASGDSFIRKITTEGTVLYERNNGMDIARRRRSGDRAERVTRTRASKL